MGWGFVQALAEHHDLWVITEEEKFRSDIESWQRTEHSSAVNPKFIFLRKRRNRFLRKIWPPSYYWYYKNWHREALDLAKKLDRELNFDLVHQLTMVGFREPGYLWKLNKPFVWGPIGGMGLFPWRFLTSVGLYGSLYYTSYNIYNAIQSRFSPRPKKAAHRAKSGLITATSQNCHAAKNYWKCDSTLLSEIGLTSKKNSFAPNVRRPKDALRLVWIGKITHRKALNLALEAVALLPRDVNWELHILGQGPLEESMRRLANRLGVGDCCHFHGHLPRERAVHMISRSHICLITSLRELTSTVTIEALSEGIPVIAPDHCGFRDAINSNSGILVPVNSPNQMIRDLVSAIICLADNEQRRIQLSKGARARATRFLWSEKVHIISEVYRRRVEQEYRL